MKFVRKLTLLAALLGIAILIGWAYRPSPVRVSVAQVTRGALQVVVREDGQTRIRERYVVTPPVTGYVQRLELHVGDPVDAGQVLFTLEPLPPTTLDARARADARARVARAGAALQATEADAQAAAAAAAYAVQEQGRLRPLFDTGQVSKTQYDRVAMEADRASAALRVARAAIDVARYEKESAETALRYSVGDRANDAPVQVRAPVKGVVLEVQREDEGVVTAGQPIMTIGDPRSLEIGVDVLSADAVRIRPGMAMQLDRWGDDVRLAGRVRTVDPTAFTKVSALGVEEQRVKVVGDLVTPPEQWSALGDAYRVEAGFVLWESEDVLRVPHSSLFRSGDGWAVYAVADGRAVVRPVEVGHLGLLHAEVVSGLDERQVIVTYPDDQLEDGTPVEIREHETGPG